MTIRCIDLETTGTDPAKDKIVDIASCDIVKVSDKHTLTNLVETLVNPGIPIPAQASAVHHIIDADVASAHPIEAVIENFFEHHDDRLIFIAHNASFERSFLDPWLHETETAAEWICTYRCALRVWPDLPSHNLQFLRYHFGFASPLNIARSSITAHRALSDCVVTAPVFLALVQRAKLSDMLAWSMEPPLKTILQYGKHKGKRYDAVPDYLDWIIYKSDFDDDEKWCARYWLEKSRVPA